jgi:predicted ATPase
LRTNHFFVLTGGPGAGKTTVIDGLTAEGYAGTVEAGRAVIQDQSAIDGPALPWKDPALFAEHMLTWEMRSHAIARETAGTVFFDRGVPDVIGYLRLSEKPVPIHVERAAEKFRYNRRVFVFPPWRAIFRQDEERRQDFAEAERTFEAVRDAYRDVDYQCVEVPMAPPAERVRFILQNMSD